jgi:uncharacterized protein (UPF0332 family)
MIMDSNDRSKLIRFRLKQAAETISDVQLLMDNNRLRSAVNRIYYGMFYSLLALALANQFETSKHSQLIGWFNKNFINEGLIDARYGKSVNRAFNKRTKGDYDTFVDFEKEIVIEMFTEMQEFIAMIESYIKVD